MVSYFITVNIFTKTNVIDNDNSFHRNLGVLYSRLIFFTVVSIVQLTLF